MGHHCLETLALLGQLGEAGEGQSDSAKVTTELPPSPQTWSGQGCPLRCHLLPDAGSQDPQCGCGPVGAAAPTMGGTKKNPQCHSQSPQAATHQQGHPPAGCSCPQRLLSPLCPPAAPQQLPVRLSIHPPSFPHRCNCLLPAGEPRGEIFTLAPGEILSPPAPMGSDTALPPRHLPFPLKLGGGLPHPPAKLPPRRAGRGRG